MEYQEALVEYQEALVEYQEHDLKQYFEHLHANSALQVLDSDSKPWSSSYSSPFKRRQKIDEKLNEKQHRND